MKQHLSSCFKSLKLVFYNPFNLLSYYIYFLILALTLFNKSISSHSHAPVTFTTFFAMFLRQLYKMMKQAWLCMSKAGVASIF